MHGSCGINIAERVLRDVASMLWTRQDVQKVKPVSP